MSRTRSPGYPNFSLRQAVQRAEKVFNADRRNPLDREVAAKHMGYGGLSGAADKALATMMHYDLFERVGKGEVRVSQLAVDILHPDAAGQRRKALREAAFAPDLFKSLQDRFPGGVSEEALKSYLVRENFLDRAIGPVTAAYADTCAFLKQEGAYESGGAGAAEGAEPPTSDQNGDGPEFGGAAVGDLVQWVSQGALQFETSKRVRVVSEDGRFVAVEGSETGIPMDQITVEERGAPPPSAPPRFPLGGREGAAIAAEAGETEWLRNRVGRDTKVRLLVTGDMGPREIGKLIRLLEAQRAVLEDEDDSDA